MINCALRRIRKRKNSKIESHNQEENAQASAEVNDGDQANDKEGLPVLCAGHFSGSSSESWQQIDRERRQENDQNNLSAIL